MLPLALLLSLAVAERDWTVEVVGKGEAIAVGPLTDAEAAAWKATPPKEPADVLAVFADKGDLAMLGSWKLDGRTVVFVPRFPLVAGVPYRVVLNAAKLPAAAAGATAVTKTVQLPKPPPGPAAVVEAVYPSADVLPENQLKFYLHFSAPMSRGEVYRRVRLLDAAGKAIVDPFLELDEELWDRDQRRLTLFIDPGRIKQGLRPREEMGPVFEADRKYTLVIDAAWKDGDGEPLKAEFRKAFKTVGPDEKQPDFAGWKLTPPKAGTTEPLAVAFGESLEQALAARLIWVEDAAGKRVAGKATLGANETTWRWTPDAAWAVGEYKLVADKRVEDLAGNSIEKPFEVDVFNRIQREVVAEVVRRPFQIER